MKLGVVKVGVEMFFNPKKDFVINDFLKIADMIKIIKKNKKKISSTECIKVNWSELNGSEG